jgi:hypothetical protein
MGQQHGTVRLKNNQETVDKPLKTVDKQYKLWRNKLNLLKYC